MDHLLPDRPVQRPADRLIYECVHDCAFACCRYADRRERDAPHSTVWGVPFVSLLHSLRRPKSRRQSLSLEGKVPNIVRRMRWGAHHRHSLTAKRRCHLISRLKPTASPRGEAKSSRRKSYPTESTPKSPATTKASLCREAFSSGSQPLPKAPSSRARKPCFGAAGARRRVAAVGAVTCQLFAKKLYIIIWLSMRRSPSLGFTRA